MKKRSARFKDVLYPTNTKVVTALISFFVLVLLFLSGALDREVLLFNFLYYILWAPALALVFYKEDVFLSFYVVGFVWQYLIVCCILFWLAKRGKK